MSGKNWIVIYGDENTGGDICDEAFATEEEAIEHARKAMAEDQYDTSPVCIARITRRSKYKVEHFVSVDEELVS